MKTHILILCSMVFVISACLSPSGGSPAQPQVTVTSEVTVTFTPPPPTPTLHPQFVALQEQIAASGERFTLSPQGIIEDNGAPIPGITVAPDGTMTLTVNGETVQIDPADVDLDDEKGITIKGYEFLDTDGDETPDSWVEAISEAMQQTNKLIEMYGLADEVASEEVIVVEEGGAVNVVKKGTGGEADEVMIRTIEGQPSKFSLEFAVDEIAAKSCQPTDFKPSSDGLLLAVYSEEFSQYRESLLGEFNYQYRNGGPGLYNVLVKRDGSCWGITDGSDLYFRDKLTVPHKIPLIKIRDEVILEFVSNR